MGQSTAETVKEIEEIRGRLTEELSELQERLPAPAVWVKRVAGIVVSGGLAGSAFWFLVRRARKRRRPPAAPPVEAVIHVLPERWADRLGDVLEEGRWRTWAGAAAGAWLLLRLAELRQLRRLHRSLVAERAWRG